MRKNWKYILVLTFTLALVVTVEWLSPQPLNWTPTLSKEDRIPFGSHILFHLLPDLFPGQPIRTANRTIYEEEPDSTSGNYLFISQYFDPGSEDVQQLMEWVSQGNHAFIAAEEFGEQLADTFKLDTQYDFRAFSDSFPIRFVNPALVSAGEYTMSRMNTARYFSAFDTLRTVVLGIDSLQRPNFIKIDFGKGQFYLHTLPLAFTNYHMLYRNNADYVATALSYLPPKPLIWDEYYKPGVREQNASPLRFFLQNESLRWATYLSLAALVLFILFEAKRRQRIIPVIRPLANSSLEFTETIGRLYFQHQDHKNLAEKKIAYLLDYIRSHFFLATDQWDKAFFQALHQKTGIDQEEILHLFKTISRVQKQTMIAEVELLELNREIEQFYEKVK